jgi:hypothetical protein
MEGGTTTLGKQIICQIKGFMAQLGQKKQRCMLSLLDHVAALVQF